MMMLAHEVLSWALLWTCFCRAVRMHSGTRRDVRLAFWSLSLASVASICAPVRGWQPDGVTLCLLLGIVAVQLTTALYWQRTVPESFGVPAHSPRRQHGKAHDGEKIRGLGC